MADMTVREAASILSAVSQQHRAAKLLEEALKVAVAIEGIVKTKTEEKEALDIQISEFHTKLADLGNELEEEKKKKDVALVRFSSLIAAAQAEATEAQRKSEKKIKELEEEYKGWSVKLKSEHTVLVGNLKEHIKGKEEELASIEAKLRTARNDIAKAKERLG